MEPVGSMGTQEGSQDIPPLQDRKSVSNVQIQHEDGKHTQIPEQAEPHVSGNWLVELLEDCFDVKDAMKTVLSDKAKQVQASVEVIFCISAPLLCV